MQNRLEIRISKWCRNHCGVIQEGRPIVTRKKKKSKVPSGQGPALSSSTRSLVGDIQRDRSQSVVDERQDQDSESLANLAEETGLRSFDPYLPENPVAGSSHI